MDVDEAMRDTIAKLRKSLEPYAVDYTLEGQDMIAVSTAISLKRIADSMGAMAGTFSNLSQTNTHLDNIARALWGIGTELKNVRTSTNKISGFEAQAPRAGS